jgi:hypothetical protein
MNLDDKESPFQPGKPVDPNYFKGRKENIKEVSKYLKQSVSGDSQHFFITGKRGIGKSSFARYIGEIAKIHCNMISVHLYLTGMDDVRDLVKEIILKIVSETEENWKDKIISLFGGKIQSVSYGGLKFEFNPSDKEISVLTNNFSDVLINIVKEAGYGKENGKKGLFIVIDDINGLTENEDFANWYKSFADTLATDFPRKAPIFIVLSGLPGKKETLFEYNPSFSRIFHYTELEILERDEIKDFYISTFKEVGMTVNNNALELMIDHCSGLPTMMHEIGDAVFWADTDFKINITDAIRGVLKAGNQIGEKYLQPVIKSSIRSDKYKSILKKLGDHCVPAVNDGFTKKELDDVFNDDEKRVFSSFLRRAKKLGIIELASSKKQGTYKFTNNLYPVYFMIQHLASQEKE